MSAALEGAADRNVLIIEDDPDIAAVMRLQLEDAHYRVIVAGDGRQGLNLAKNGVGLVVLDLMLPGLDGIEVCRQLVKLTPRPLILIVSSRSSEGDRVMGLDVGADDYVVKPFSVLELAARVRALFRRAAVGSEGMATDEPHAFSAGELKVDRWQRCAYLAGRKIELTHREFDLLLWLVCHPNRVYSRAELLDHVWGGAYDGFEHTVNSHLNRLRSKIERDPSRPELLVTVRGGGYLLRSPATLESSNP